MPQQLDTMAIFKSPVQAEVAEYLKARDKLVAAAAKAFPVGSWARVLGTQIVGKVHAYCTDADYVGLILEHGDVRIKSLLNLEQCQMPVWAKCNRCGLELNSDRFGRQCPHCS